MRRLGNLRAIQAFEAAARYENYSEAAAELGVTPAAVGQHVRALEAILQIPLFRRLGSGENRLVLTDAGNAALPDFREGLDHLDAGLRRLRQGNQPTVMTASVSQAFAARWLLPRLYSFTMAHPEVDLRLDVSDRLVDVAHGDADVAIRCGPGGWPGVVESRLMGEAVLPVCSPALLAGSTVPKNARQLAALPLIHDLTMAQAAVFPSWRQWLHAAGHDAEPKTPGLHINASAAVIQAAISGQGVALARQAFVSEELSDGRLLRLLPGIEWPIPWSYFVVYPEKSQPRAPVQAFLDWLVTQAT